MEWATKFLWSTPMNKEIIEKPRFYSFNLTRFLNVLNKFFNIMSQEEITQYKWGVPIFSVVTIIL